MAKEDESKLQKKHTRIMRVCSFSAGCVFLALAVVDATLDPFPGPETFFGATGVTLIAVGVAGKSPKGGDQP